MFLTGNFGELRSNHFHSGIDIRTDGRTGLPVLAVADGFVSRISVSPFGFGNALYVDHPNGTTTVYGHLNAFSAKIQEYVREIQYEKESFSTDIDLPSSKFPVKKGEQIAFSGNSGSSGGPHLHFEIRDTKTEHTLNPLKYPFKVADHQAPKILSVHFYPVGEDAVISGKSEPKSVETVFYNNQYQIKNGQVIPVYGTVGFGVQVVDYLDGNGSKCGIYSLNLKVDGQSIYSFKMDEFDFDESRYINSHIDYEQKVRNDKNVYKTWLEPGNKLSIYNDDKNGLFSFTDDKKHAVRYEITDVNGNISVLAFSVLSKKQTLLKPEKKGILFEYDESNEFENDWIELDFPKNSFYSNFYFDYEQLPKLPNVFSKVHKVHNKYVPIHQSYTMKVKAENLPNKLQPKALIAFVNPENGMLSAIGGQYDDGWVECKLRSFGCFAVAVDTIAPTIAPLSITNKNALTEKNQIRFRIKDDFSGIGSYRATLDGKWALFEYDAKSNTIVHKFDPSRFTFPKKHQLFLRVEDVKGNIKTYEATFYK